jgi:hypothetical protein
MMSSLLITLVLPVAAAGAAQAELTCQSPELKGLPFCDASLPVSLRVADLLPRLNLTEKIGQTGMVATREKEIGVQGAHVNPLGLFLRTPIQFIWRIWSAFPPP